MLQGIYAIYLKKPVPDLQKRQRNVNVFIVLCDFINLLFIILLMGVESRTNYLHSLVLGSLSQRSDGLKNLLKHFLDDLLNELRSITF